MITVEALQHANSFEATQCFGSNCAATLEELAVEHVDLQRELGRLPENDVSILRMMAEGYRQREISRILGISQPSISRRLTSLLELVPASNVIPLLMAMGASGSDLLARDPRA